MLGASVFPSVRWAVTGTCFLRCVSRSMHVKSPPRDQPATRGSPCFSQHLPYNKSQASHPSLCHTQPASPDTMLSPTRVEVPRTRVGGESLACLQILFPPQLSLRSMPAWTPRSTSSAPVLGSPARCPLAQITWTRYWKMPPSTSPAVPTRAS